MCDFSNSNQFKFCQGSVALQASDRHRPTTQIGIGLGSSFPCLTGVLWSLIRVGGDARVLQRVVRCVRCVSAMQSELGGCVA